MEFRTLLTILSTLFILSACGGGDEGFSGDPLAADIQGKWVQSACTPGEGQSSRLEASVSGDQIVQTQVLFINSAGCTGNFTVNINLRGTVTVLGTTTETAGGVAKNANVSYMTGDVTASPGFLSLLESQGTTLQATATSLFGVEDIDNLDLDSRLPSTELYTIYRIDGNRLRIGLETDERSGSTAESRLNELWSSFFIKQ